MNYADIRPIDVANGPGVRTSIFVSGCTHHCKECFNPETWDFAYGQPFGGGADTGDPGLPVQTLHSRSVPAGGRAFRASEPAAVLELVRAVRARFPEKDILVLLRLSV